MTCPNCEALQEKLTAAGWETLGWQNEYDALLAAKEQAEQERDAASACADTYEEQYQRAQAGVREADARAERAQADTRAERALVAHLQCELAAEVAACKQAEQALADCRRERDEAVEMAQRFASAPDQNAVDVVDLRAALTTLRADHARVKGENARLRDALEGLAVKVLPDGDERCCFCREKPHWPRIHTEPCERARAALTGDAR